MLACRLSLLAIVGCVASPIGSLAQERLPAPQVVLEQAASFVDPDGAPVSITPGTYAIEAATGPALRVVGQERTSATIIEAVAIHHEESLSDSIAALILTEEDTLHLVLLRPDGTALDAVGSLTGVRSRAPAPMGPGTSPTPLTPDQVQQGFQASGGMVRPAGMPPAPVLAAPLIGHTVAAWGEAFSWQPGSGTPAPTSYRLCLAEAGKPCAKPGQASTTSLIIDNLPPTARSYRVTGPMLQAMLAYGQQKSLTWTVGACTPYSITTQTMGSGGGAASQITCHYARTRPLTWKLVVKAPVPVPPDPPLVNDRPQLSIQGPVEGAQYYVFCLSYIDLGDHTRHCDQASRDPAVQQAGASVVTEETIVVNTGSALSTSGWEWKRDVAILPPQLSTRIPVVGIPFSVYNDAPMWLAGACLGTAQPCSWSSPIRLTFIPGVSSIGIRLVRESPTRVRIEWPGATSAAVTHYRLCIATRGSQLRFTEAQRAELIWLPGMLRDLCSDDIPPGQQPAYQRPLPQELAHFCPAGGCQLPRPGKTIYVAGTLAYILNLREHPDLAPLGGQPLFLAIAACSYSNRNCLWHVNGYRSLDIPVDSQAPSLRLGYGTSSFTFNWDAWWGNTYYIPCLREANATCDTGNLLNQPRLDAPRAGTPQDHPQTCALTGPSLSGHRVLQVAGCNEAWGCRWSPPQQFNFSSVRLPPSQAALRCR